MDKDRRANFLRKLHSFAGVFPLGIFLCFHMLVNYSATWGVTITPRSQQIAEYVLIAVFVAFAAFALRALWAFAG